MALVFNDNVGVKKRSEGSHVHRVNPVTTSWLAETLQRGDRHWIEVVIPPESTRACIFI
jgi:hypothetical protein